jgi:FtsP/CotA-like multicopper oxidase with cupredoxin domain
MKLRVRAIEHPFHLVLPLLALCASPAWAGPSAALAPPGWDAGIKLQEAVDRNPDPDIVEIDMTAKIAEVEVSPGKKVRAWTYDGGLPGPLVRTKVGDRLIVHFTNELEQETTIHWHGVRVPIEMDGVPEISQPPVRKGETFVYDFVVRDAGLYWYHPHVMSAAQVGFGLYGALLVEDPEDGIGVEDEVTIVLSDIGFDKRGELEDPEGGGSAGMVFGREGAYVLVNGRVRPNILARSGAPQRWRIVNAAKSRFFYLELEGQPLMTIGGDGGLQEHPVTSDIVLVTAGERVDLVVTPTGQPGEQLVLRSMLYNRGYGSVEYRTVEELMTVTISDQPHVENPVLPDFKRTIEPISTEGATPVNVVLTLPPVDVNGHSEFRVDGVPYWKAKPYNARVGERQIWTVKNDTEWDHPWHQHGFFFMVLDENNQPVKPMVWKDTINIPMKSTARFIVDFDERPGMWMFHCHILDHADGGLMGHVDVAPAGTTENQAPRPGVHHHGENPGGKK